MMIQAVLGNPNHPEYGVATIPFPIPHDQYAHCMELLEALEIGDAVKADCKVEKIDSFYTVLKRTEMLTVNVEELNYLAKRLDSFDTGEAAQFQAMAHKLELFELKDLINLTFCCQQATVITDFSDLAAVGRDHYMNLHGGSASVDELNALDGEETARQLIESGSGTITPYGVVYDNGMKLEQIYDGRFFPCYYYKPNVITVAVTSKAEPEDTEHITWLFLPMVQEEIDRALLRGGITDPADVRLRLEDSQLPNEVDVLLDMEYETLSDLNELAEATDGLSKADMEKLGAVVMLAEPKSATQIKNLAESLDLFDFAPGAHTPQEYGKYMIQQSGRFEYDENLDAFYDYEKYGMSSYIHFTEEQKQRAAAVDLEEFLRCRGEKLLSSGREKRLASDHSVTVRGNEWYDHAEEQGGHAVSFVQRFYGLSYPDAVMMLLGGELGAVYPSAEGRTEKPAKPFALPPANKDMRRVFAYLIKHRGIARDVVAHFAKAGLLYEDAEYHNAVFVGTDAEGVPRHAHKRSANSYGKAFRLNVEGSDPRYSFHHIGTDRSLYVFEAPIDMLSYITLYPEDWQRHSYVACCGTSIQPVLQMLEQTPQLDTVLLCLDNDEAGHQASRRMREQLETHYSVERLISENKDWNDDLTLSAENAQGFVMNEMR